MADSVTDLLFTDDGSGALAPDNGAMWRRITAISGVITVNRVTVAVRTELDSMDVEVELTTTTTIDYTFTGESVTRTLATGGLAAGEFSIMGGGGDLNPNHALGAFVRANLLPDESVIGTRTVVTQNLVDDEIDTTTTTEDITAAGRSFSGGRVGFFGVDPELYGDRSARLALWEAGTDIPNFYDEWGTLWEAGGVVGDGGTVDFEPVSGSDVLIWSAEITLTA